MSKERESWIDILRFPLIVGVILIHGYDPIRGIDGNIYSLQGISAFADGIMFFFSQVLTRLSVPLFFLFAGYFFLKKINYLEFSSWKNQFYKRCNSLLIPFIFWNGCLFLLFFSLQYFGIYQLVPKSVGLIKDKSFFEIINVTFGVTQYPISYQFWFIRDLFLCVTIAVVTIFIQIKIYWVMLITLLFFWLTGWFEVTIPSAGALFFFFLGGALYRNYAQLPMPRLSKYWLGIYLIIAVIEVACRDESYRLLLHKLNILIGVFSCYWIAYYIGKFSLLKVALLRLSSASFFVFAFHEPVLTLVKKITYSFLDNASSTKVLVIYFGNVFFVIAISLMVWNVLIAAFPRFTAIISGGR